MVFSANGIGVKPLVGLSQLIDALARVVFVLMLMLLAKVCLEDWVKSRTKNAQHPGSLLERGRILILSLQYFIGSTLPLHRTQGWTISSDALHGRRTIVATLGIFSVLYLLIIIW